MPTMAWERNEGVGNRWDGRKAVSCSPQLKKSNPEPIKGREMGGATGATSLAAWD